jgi:predicted nucleotidyltransferase
MNTSGLALKQDELAIVEKILRRYVPDREVWAFGSRTRPPCKPFSDLDLAILGSEPLPLGVMVDLKDEFSESDFPYRVDIVDWATTSERFRQIIEQRYVPIQQPA